MIKSTQKFTWRARTLLAPRTITRQGGWRYDALVSARRGFTVCASKRGGGAEAGSRERLPTLLWLGAALCSGLIDRARPRRGPILLPWHATHAVAAVPQLGEFPPGYSSLHILECTVDTL
ncbi:unnamed protein product, partial [Brenthis ino]